MDPDRFCYEFLKDGASEEMAVNGASAAVDFDFAVPAGRTLNIHRVMFEWIDDAVEDVDGFFSIAALTNGLLIQAVEDDGSTVIHHFATDDEPIKRHGDLGVLAGVDVTGASATPAASRWGVRWTLSKAAGGEPFTLQAGQIFRVKVQDDLSSAVTFRGLVQGAYSDFK